MQTRERVFQDNLKVYVNSKHFVEFHVVFFSCSIGGSRDTYQYLESKFRLTMQEDYCAAILEPNKSLGSLGSYLFLAMVKEKRLHSELEPQAKVYIGRTCKFDLTLASVCIKFYIHKASIFYLFYKITLDSHICIALYKHGN